MEGRRYRKKCIILTDSNGREATDVSIKNHFPKEEREKYDISVVAAYTTEEAYRRVGTKEIDVDDAAVVVDLLTNDVRGTRQRPAASPEELVRRVHMLRERLQEAGASSVVVCQIKPMEVADVTPYNTLMEDYLRTQKGTGYGFGCRTQVRRSYLRSDGYHVQKQYESVIDRTYACAILGWHVPSPTPFEDFLPGFARRRYQTEYPSLMGGNEQGRGLAGEGLMNSYGY